MMTTDRTRVEELVMTPEGKTDRPIQLARWWVPAVELDDGSRSRRSKWPGGYVVEEEPHPGTWLLRWNRKSVGRHARYTPGLLVDFLLLEKAEPKQILRFARRYGVLGVCTHGLPASHSRVTPRLLLDDMRADGCEPQQGGTAADEAWEEVAVWRTYARKFQGLLGVAKSLRAGEPPRREDRAWLASPHDEPGHALLVQFSNATSTVVSTGPGTVTGLDAATRAWERELRRLNPDVLVSDSEDRAAIGRPPRIGRGDIAEALTLLVAQAGIRPMVTWTSAAPVLTFTGSGLFAALVMQLVLACTSGSAEGGLAICAGCGVAYPPKCQPRDGKRSYCSACGRRASVRDGARRYRQTKGYRRWLRKRRS